MTQIFLYNHGGSENHGCEALIRTVSRVMKSESEITFGKPTTGYTL